MWPETLADLRGPHRDRVILRAVSGSRLYGLATPTSDVDERGIFALPLAAYGDLEPPTDHIQDERGDTAYHDLRKFLTLAAAANPNALELLFLPTDCVLAGSAAFEHLVAARATFLTRQCFETHVGYARTQVRRARGQNKWVNNPQPESPPRLEDHCRVILGPWPDSGPPADAEALPPFRPQPLASSGLDLAEHVCASLEHAPGIYRLYHYGAGARGVLRAGQVVCESIPKADEFTRIVGLLIVDEPGFRQAQRDHKHYWQWRSNRNEERWRTQENGDLDYDPKNLMHTLRLVRCAAAILRDGQPKIRFEGEERDFLLAVRAGRFSYAELLERVEDEVHELEPLAASSSLPATADRRAVDRLLREATELSET